MPRKHVTLQAEGRALSWEDAKKRMGNGETFLSKLLTISPESVTPKQLKALMPYVKSPVFRPEAIAPVCLCAAKVTATKTNPH